jgi:2-polyprenyl-3-methyl-5-hydroxy-6-metoxy-1,4-benzoquinol methylase
VNDRTSEFFDRYAVDFDSIYGNDNRALERIANRLFRHAMLVRYQKTIAGCQPIAGRTVIDIGSGPGHYSIALARAGAKKVLGLDFAAGMLKIARERAQAYGVAERCAFELGDFLTYPMPERFDYAVVMGFMDYVAEPRAIVDRVLEIVRLRAFFSFPKAGGPLAWQRQWRYRNRCDLFLYREQQIRDLLAPTGAAFSIESIGRDFFVTLTPKSVSQTS